MEGVCSPVPITISLDSIKKKLKSKSREKSRKLVKEKHCKEKKLKSDVKKKSDVVRKKKKVEEYTPENSSIDNDFNKIIKEFNVDLLNSETAPEIHLEYTIPPHLILAYTYFLNDNFNKFISIGFSAQTLKPVVVLHHIGQSAVILSTSEWYSLFLNQKDIESAFTGTPFKAPKYLSEEAKIEQDTSFRIFLNKTSKFEFNINDWQCFVHLSELFKSILHLYTRTQDTVQLFYVKYTQLCFEKNVMCLDTSNFFVIENPFNLNLQRLFNELGLLFRQKCLNGMMN